MTNTQIDFTNVAEGTLTVEEVFTLISTNQLTLTEFNDWCQLQHESSYENGVDNTQLFQGTW